MAKKSGGRLHPFQFQEVFIQNYSFKPFDCFTPLFQYKIMSTKKKQDSANEKKVSFFSFRQRFKGNVPSDPTSAEESGPSIAAEALLASTTTDAATGFDRPNSSKKGAARKVTKFFKAIKKSRSKTPKKDHLQPQPAISEQISANPLAVANQLIEKAITGQRLHKSKMIYSLTCATTLRKIYKFASFLSS